MNNVIYITGHRNPDTDSICSAIAYSEFKNKTGSIPTVPIRLGNINRETQYILDYFDVEQPELVETVRTQVADLNIDKVAPVSPDISLRMAWSIMKKNKLRTLPVVDEHENLIGVVSVSNLTSTYMDIWDNTILSKSNTPLENIIDTLSAKAIYVNDNKQVFNGKIISAAMKPSSVESIVNEGDIVICGDREDTQALLIEKKASLLIITGDHNISDKIIKEAEKFKCNIIVTPFDTFTASRLITQSIPINYVMTNSNIISFSIDDFVEDIKDIMLETRYRSYPVLDRNNKVVGAISRYHLISKNRKKVILLDHNEKTQSVNGLQEAEVMEIIDHHRIADVETGLPIYFRNEPVGSTATIVASIFFENGIRPSVKIAGLLSAAIISDTLLLKSPTSTSIDEHILKRLAQIANIDIDEFAKEMFKAGTSLEGKSPSEIFYGDFKSFLLNELNVGVSQVSTLYMEGFVAKKDSLIELMDKTCKDDGYDLLILMATDILKAGSEIIAVGPHKEIAEKAFDIKPESNSIYKEGVISRKKQIIPPITEAINSSN